MTTLDLTSTVNNAKETALIVIIQRRLSSQEQERFSYLTDKLEIDELTELEHNEYREFVERIEHEDAERVKALV